MLFLLCFLIVRLSGLTSTSRKKNPVTLYKWFIISLPLCWYVRALPLHITFKSGQDLSEICHKIGLDYDHWYELITSDGALLLLSANKSFRCAWTEVNEVLSTHITWHFPALLGLSLLCVGCLTPQFKGLCCFQHWACARNDFATF